MNPTVLFLGHITHMFMIKCVIRACDILIRQVAGMHSDAAALRKCSIWHEASRIVREEGFGAFWKGNLVTIVHRLPYSAMSFYSYERYKKLLGMVPGLDDPNYVSVVRLLGGGLAGVTAASVTYPLDVVRTRLATQVHFSSFCE
uniref:Uncharacterized protein n=1 Tax=Aegilops tauschii subsp. strangulata TaxID=200361 RepID=A0A453DWN9_AEGTS